MEQIVIEVANDVAEKWRSISPKIKSSLETSFEKQIAEAAQKADDLSFDKLLMKARDEAADKGLSEEVLQQLLNEK